MYEKMMTKQIEHASFLLAAQQLNLIFKANL